MAEDLRTVILVPMRPDHGHRDMLWRFCKAIWDERFPELPIYEGLHLDGPFNRSAAINTAAALAGQWDVALIIDSDVICDPRAIRSSIDVAVLTGRMVVAHDARVMINHAGTVRIMKGFRGAWDQRGMYERIWYDSVSSAVVVTRELWERVEGFDEKFVGWGREDSAFQMACEAEVGPFLRVSGKTFHLWHEHAPEGQRTSPLRQANEKRYEAYLAARWDRDAIKELRR